jgi:hypothetical protein
MGRKLPFRCSVRLHCRLFRPFSDSLIRGILRSPFAGSCIDRPPRGVRMTSKALHAAWRRSTSCGVGWICSQTNDPAMAKMLIHNPTSPSYCTSGCAPPGFLRAETPVLWPIVSRKVPDAIHNSDQSPTPMGPGRSNRGAHIVGYSAPQRLG